MRKHSYLIVLILFIIGIFVQPILAQSSVKILTNHLGYYPNGPKHCVILGTQENRVSNFFVKDYETQKTLLKGEIKKAGRVDKWKNWIFWEFDFTELKKEGEYYIECDVDNGKVVSFPFIIQENLLERNTLSDIIYYFKCKRTEGLFGKADSNIPFEDWPGKRIDAHGGWMDATGDYSKALSHLSGSTWFNPQQLPLVAYNLFNVYEELERKKLDHYIQYKERILDEAFYGADYLVRIHPKGSSFYQNLNAPGKEKTPEDRYISLTNNFLDSTKKKFPKEAKYCSSFRSGAGISIAALAQASAFDICGDFSNKKYLEVAEEAFLHLQKYNIYYTNNGKENIVDDYCALIAATELFKVTKKDVYKKASYKRAKNLISRLSNDENYNNYWAADDKNRPFFHAADAGIVVVGLLRYANIADQDMRGKILEAVKKSMTHELKITSEVINPFGYARQYVQNIKGERYSSFFFPHETETRWWWQGEDARLASLVSAAKLTARYFKNDKDFYNQLKIYTTNQINWILGLNPFDVCMLTGTGRNNPEYLFYSSWEYTSTPGGICNGITAGLNDINDIDFQVGYEVTGEDHDWRWGEQWLPHTAWFIYAISINY